MYAKYGTVQHPDNQVAFTTSRQFRPNPRNGRRISEVKTVRMNGFVKGTTQAELKTKIAELENMYAQDALDWGFYHDDGTLSAHSLVNTGAMLAPVMVKDITFGDEQGGQYATQRTYSITLEAEYLSTSGNQLIDWRESVQITGDGGPRFIVTETVIGRPVRDQTTNSTMVRARQAGTAVGLLDYPVLEVPPPLWPQFLVRDNTNNGSEYPTRRGGILHYFPVNWSYLFESPVPLVGASLGPGGGPFLP